MDTEFYRGKTRSDRLSSNFSNYNGPEMIDRCSLEKGSDGGLRDSYYYGSKQNGRVHLPHDEISDWKSRDHTEDSKSVDSLDSTGKRKSFRRLLTRFADKSSMTGVPYISNAKYWWVKLIWSVMLLVAIGILTGHLWYLVDQYTSWPIQTKISLGFETLKFPEITICNTNVMHKGRFDRYNGAKKLKLLVNALQPEELAPDQFKADYDPLATPAPADDPPSKRRRRFVDQYESFNTSEFDEDDTPNAREMKPQDDDDYGGEVDEKTEITDLFTELYMDIDKQSRAHLGHNISDMLLSCTFNGRDCPPNMFVLHQTSEFGNCWSVMSSKFNVKTSGPSAGLSMILFLETGEYLKGVSTGHGVRVHVHEQRTFPFPAEEGLYISAAMETDIGLRLISIERRGGRYGDCDNGDTFDSNYNLKYTRRACQTFCEISKVIDECKCFNEESEEFARLVNSTIRPCRSTSEVECMVGVERQFENQEFDCACDNPCSEAQYVKSTSQRQWPGEEYAMVLLQGICEKDKTVCASMREDMTTISNNFAKLNVYYEDLNYENITEEPEIELQQFLSDVGGAIGLWIGLSVLSLCELIQLFVELCDYGIHKTIKERRREKKKRRKERKKLAAASNQNFSTKYENRWPNTNFDNGRKSDYSYPGNDVMDNTHYSGSHNPR